MYPVLCQGAIRDMTNKTEHLTSKELTLVKRQTHSEMQIRYANDLFWIKNAMTRLQGLA